MKLSRYHPAFVVVVALAALLAAVSGVGLAAGSEQAAAKRPPPRTGADLKVLSVAGAPASVEPAGRVVFSTVVANVGERAAGTSDVRYVLAREERPVAKDLALVVDHSVASLRPRQRLRSGSLLAVVPPDATPGAFWLFACVKLRPPGKERKLANNCLRVRRIRVETGEPLAVTPVLAEDRSVSAMVGPEGGSVEATAPNGAVMRLVVPEGALTGRALIRLVPLAGLDGLSVEGVAMLGGVEIEPRGLLLEEPARLELTPPSGSAGPSLAFWYDPGGKDAHLVPFVRAPAFGSLVSRFGGYVLASAADPVRAALAVPLPADPAYRIEEAISEVLLGAGIQARKGHVKARGDDDWLPEELRMLAIARYVDEIRPRLVALSHGVADPDAALAVLTRLQGELIRQLELVGIDDALANWTEDASTLIQQVVKRIFERRLELCRQGDVRNAVNLIGFMYRTAAHGLDAPIGLPPYVKGLEEVLGPDWTSRAAVCMRLRFGVDFDTTNEWRVNVPHGSEDELAWRDRTSGQARLAGYSQTQGEPATALIQAWQQGELLRWKGGGVARIDQLTNLNRTEPFDQIKYRNGRGVVAVEIVPMVETFDPKLQRVDTTGRLLIRFYGNERCDGQAEGPNLWDDRPFVVLALEWINLERGDDGKFDQRRGDPTSIGRERWYELPLQGGTLTLAEGGPRIVFPTLRNPPGTWSVNGSLTVTAIPPGVRVRDRQAPAPAEQRPRVSTHRDAG